MATLLTHDPNTADYWREQDRDLVEATASGATIDVRQLGLARAELIVAPIWHSRR
jgi:hypothetical protein